MSIVHTHASGKVILLGEHAVVYGQPAIAVPVSQVGVDVTIEVCKTPARVLSEGIGLDEPIDNLPNTHPIKKAIGLFLHETSVGKLGNVMIRIRSSIPVASGLGSGAAVSVALLRALDAHFGAHLDAAKINELAYEVEKIHHGTPSGIDNSVIAYAKPVYYTKGLPIETFIVASPIHLLVADTGVGALTKVAVSDVRYLTQEQPEKFMPLIEKIGDLVRQGRQAMEFGDLPLLGQIMLQDQELLRQLTVSSPELETLIKAAMGAGALGAKLSGGGRGGNMIALVRDQANLASVTESLLSAGARAVYQATVSPS